MVSHWRLLSEAINIETIKNNNNSFGPATKEGSIQCPHCRMYGMVERRDIKRTHGNNCPHHQAWESWREAHKE